MKKTLSILLCLAMCLSLSVGAFASGEASGGDQMYGISNEENSVIVIKNGVLTENAEAGSYSLAASGEMSAEGISGLYLTAADENSNGVYLAAGDDDSFVFGGEEDFYDVEGVGAFNSVIDVCAPMSDPNAECYYGVGITTAGGLLTVENTYIRTEGFRASTIYTPSGEHETNLVVKDSVLRADGAPGGFMPDFKLLVGSARATLFLGEDIWLYNSALIARDWGAISHDTNTRDIQLYAVNTCAETYNGGYVIYALDGTENFLYGSKLVSPQYGMFVMGEGTAVLDSVDAADEAALTYADGVDFSQSVTGDGRSLLVGGCNAVVFHVNGSVMNPGTFTVRNATVSTMPEDVVSDFGDDMVFDLDCYLLEPVIFGESWFYMEKCLGSLIVTRSHGGNISFEEGAVLKPANGVLVETMIAYDPDAGSIFHDSSDTRALQDVTVNIDTPVVGDILHEDYQRNMRVNVNAEYTGCVTTGSITAWNSFWSAEGLAALLEQGGHTGDFELNDEVVANIRSRLVREENAAAYTDVFGVYMTVAGGAVWNVEGRSSVLSLTLEEGGAVNAAEIYVNCAFGADGYLDPSTGTAVSELSAGDYENVVLIGGAQEELPVVSIDGEDYVALADVLTVVGA